MIVIEKIEIRGKEFQRHYSDKGYKIHKIGTDEIYDEAVDLLDKNYDYEETDILIDSEATEDDYQSALEDLGVDFND